MTPTVSASGELLSRSSASALSRPLVLYGVLGAVAAAGGATLLATSDHLAYPVAYAVLAGNVVAGTIGVGLYWLARRPASRFGPLLIALGFVYAGIAFQGINDPVLHSLGVLFDPLIFLLSSYIVFAFPLGRLRRLERGLLIGAGFVFAVSFAPWFFLSETVFDWTPLGRCNAACPRNGLRVADVPGVAAEFGRLERVVFGLFAVVIFAALVYRIRSVKRPERRARAPVLAWMIALTISIAAVAVARGSPGSTERSLNAADWANTLIRGTLTYSFLVAALLAAVFAGTALRRMIAELGARPSSAKLRAVVADALDDPELELAFWLPTTSEFVNPGGRPLVPPRAGSDREITEFADAGKRVAIVHHSALAEDPELLTAAGTAILLALESGRLQAELRRTNAELQASRMRVVTAADAERRKIERDLHDSAQQHLIALRMRLGLAKELAEEGDPDLPEMLGEFGEGLDEALAELRGVAHGIYPPLLVESGLADALAQAGRRSSIPVQIDSGGIGRYPAKIEAAVYFSCVEALQNAAKHAGDGTTARVRLWEEDGRLQFEIGDDGPGFDTSRRLDGAGLLNMADRMGSMGGTIEITSADGRGTMVSGQVPVSS